MVVVFLEMGGGFAYPHAILVMFSEGCKRSRLAVGFLACLWGLGVTIH